MSNIFQAVVRRTGGAIPLKLGTSAVPKFFVEHGLIFDARGNIFADDVSPIDHYHSGMPFCETGRLAVTLDPPVRWDQTIPFAANERISFGDFIAPVVSDIVRLSGGSCQYPAAGTCIAQSVYQAIISSGEPPSDITWSVDNGASIVDGQGTSQLTVDGPSGDTDVSYNVQCDVTNSKGVGSLSKAFTDTKTEAP